MSLVSLPALLVLLVASTAGTQVNVPMRHDYKQSFKSPFVYNDTIPFFDTYANTIIGKDSIRLAASVTGQRGGIWAKEKNQHKEWEVELQLQINGREEVGGEGMAFWYTRGRGVMGPVLGNGDKWDGLMIGFDTYDNKKEKKNPFVMGILNDGKLQLSKEPDWTTKVFDGCFREFRNTEEPVFAKIRYQANELSVSVDTLRQGNGYSTCFTLPNIEIPTGYYFGITGASGRHPDDHDIFSMETYELRQGVTEKDLKHAPKMDADDRKIVKKVNEKVEEGEKKKKKAPSRGARLESTLKALQAQQNEILDKIKELAKRNPFSAPQSSPQDASKGTIRQSDQTALEASIHSLQDTVLSLSTSIQKVDHLDLASEVQRLHDLVSSLDRKLDYSNVNQESLHMETRDALNRSQAQHGSSTLYWLFMLMGGQLALYAIWTVVRMRKQKVQKKYL